MKYRFACHSDVGIRKSTNQDSLCIREAETDKGTVFFALLCDGMGGLAKGEVASATLIRVWSGWFTKDLPHILTEENILDAVQASWAHLMSSENYRIGQFGLQHNINMGSTFTGILVLEDGSYIIGHVGDSRAYRITDDSVEQLTKDQTLVAREVDAGRLSPEEAAVDPRRSILLQCIGASNTVTPEFSRGTVKEGENYLLCCDGFRHLVTKEEFLENLSPSDNPTEDVMKEHLVKLVELNKQRKETDNITAVLIGV
ncbi:MAG: serine/threonine-protein phosphatase [Lachnospiraceae bacterium]|nr:serine/threonine-protein phosphatase [Lachnospiraceae bacterium]